MQKPIYLYITPYLSHDKNWRGNFSFDAILALKRDGRYDVRVLTVDDHPDYEYHGVRIHTFKRYVLPAGLASFLLERLNNSLFLRKLKVLGIAPADVAVCHVNDFRDYSQYASFLKRKNPQTVAVAQEHWNGWMNLACGRFGCLPIHTILLYRYIRRNLEGLDALVFVSRQAKENFPKFFVRNQQGQRMRDIKSQLMFSAFVRNITPRRTFVAYNGINGDLFSSQARASHDGFRIGCVGHFTPSKRQCVLIDAIKRFRNCIGKFKVIFVGTGSELERCKAMVCQLGLGDCVEFIPKLDHATEIADFYRSLDLLVLPSCWEGFNCSIIEALGCGAMVLANDGISFREVLTPADCEKYLFRSDDSDDMARKVIALYQNPSRIQLSRNLDINAVTLEFLSELDKIKLQLQKG